MIFIYLAAYFLLFLFFMIEMFVRAGKETKTLEKTRFDQGSTNSLAVAFVLSCVLLAVTPLLNFFGIGVLSFNLLLGCIGLVVAAVGLTVRLVAVRTLGRFYTRTLRRTDEHSLVTAGIYHYLRHPGYSGNILLFTGVSLALENSITIIAVPLLVISVYIYRILTEEKMLVEIFGEKYREYQHQSKRLLPFVF